MEQRPVDLMGIQSEAQQISVSISEVIGVDVVVVDNQLRRVADTFRYPDNVIPIRGSSIIGRIIETGQPLVVDNKNYRQSCVDCKDRALCYMTGFMGVPILCGGRVAGAIGLVIAEHNVKRLVENANLILGFLQQMADYLAGKMSAQVSHESLEALSLERDATLEAADTGVVLVDEAGQIISCNQRFRSYFGLDDVPYGRRLIDCIQHPLLQAAMASRSVQPSRTIVIPLKDQVFYGRLRSQPMWRGGAFAGTAFTFLSLHGFDEESVVMPSHSSSRDIVLQMCAGRNVKRFLDLLDEAADENGPLLLSCSTRRVLMDLASSIHSESGRSGKLIVLDTFGYTDSEAEYRLFGRELAGVSPYEPNAMLLAHHGTLCICNVFLMPVFLQARLREYLRGGGGEGGFRPDVRLLFTYSPTMERPDMRFVDQELYQLLQSMEIRLPGPVEAPKKLRAYLEECLEFYRRRYQTPVETMQPAAAEMLVVNYPWTTSVRQVRQAVEYLVRTGRTAEITVEQVQTMLADFGGARRSIQEIEREEIQQLLQQGNSPEEIAKILNISRSTLYRRIKKYRLH